MTQPYFGIVVIISALKKAWPLICTILNFLSLRMILPSLDEIGKLVPEKKTLKDFFQCKHRQKRFSPLWPRLTLGDHNFYKLESALGLCGSWEEDF
jgi:hypothetical protein